MDTDMIDEFEKIDCSCFDLLQSIFNLWVSPKSGNRGGNECCVYISDVTYSWGNFDATRRALNAILATYSANMSPFILGKSTSCAQPDHQISTCGVRFICNGSHGSNEASSRKLRLSLHRIISEYEVQQIAHIYVNFIRIVDGDN